MARRVWAARVLGDLEEIGATLHGVGFGDGARVGAAMVTDTDHCAVTRSPNSGRPGGGPGR